MIYKSGKNGYYKSYEYAKSILSNIQKITEFKAFSNEEHNYYELIDNNKHYYNLILFDENSNEYWFDTKCGYKGMGSLYSEKILNLVGIREKYNIELEKEIHETNLCPNNELNLLVVEIDLSNTIEKYNIKSFIKVNFESPYLRYNFLESLNKLGCVKAINDAIGNDLYIKYFDNYISQENVFYDFGINNVLFLDSSLSNDTKSNINYEIKSLLGLENNIFINEINKIEYGIYNY